MEPIKMTSVQEMQKNLEDELNSAALYLALSEMEKNPKLAEVYRRLSTVEQSHADTWSKKLKAAGFTPPSFIPAWRTRTLIWLAKRLGPAAVLPSLAATETSKSQDYSTQPQTSALEARGMIAQEQSHARLLSQMSLTGLHGGLEGAALAQLEGRHRSAGGNALRAAVLGANDGLLSNFSLLMGVAGAQMSPRSILLTGLAGLLAGATSMALGEWISVQSSRELFLRQVKVEQAEIESAPEEEAEELALIYQARGLDEAPARQLASQIMSNREGALQALSRDELGIDPQELGGSAWEAAITSFILFAAGALIPVFPFFFTSGLTAIILGAALSAIGLFAIGAAITLFTGRSVLATGARQMLFGLTAALITYLIGRLVGVAVSG
jgi:VIT1/CCC1 family predicted Fe2+/Mn2+ transporter/rubrerythrin